MQSGACAGYPPRVRPEAPSDPALRFLDLPTGRVAYTDEGEGPCLVAIHGIPGSLRDFRWLARALSSEIRFVRLDMPGFGHTEHDDPPTSWSELARWALEAAYTIAGGPFSLLGHSMGAPQASLIASLAPDAVHKLALVAPVGLRPHRAYRRSPPFTWMNAALHSQRFGRVSLALIRAAFVRLGFPRSTPDRDILRSIAVVAEIPFEDHRRAIETMSIPVLAAYADDDPLVEPAIPRELLAACPSGRRLHFDTGGHNLQKTRAIELADALRAFLTDGPGEAKGEEPLAKYSSR